MPRSKLTRNSKAVKKEKVESKATIKQEIQENQKEIDVNLLLTTIEKELTPKLHQLRSKCNEAVEAITFIAFQECTTIKSSKYEKTIGELRNEKSCNTTISTTAFSEAASMIKNSTIIKSINNTLNKTGRKKTHTDDEGYLTAGESNGRSASTDRNTHSSRKQLRLENSTRRSRSLSRSKLPKTVTIQATEKKTPQNRRPLPNIMGTVTPKVNPNKSVSILRRPKQGEMAISMQGSPLLVSSVISETCANVNIPLENGNVLSLQPTLGLRKSEIPNIDENTRLQLIALRDNLNKVVRIASEY